jgi:hypothetical protein
VFEEAEVIHGGDTWWNGFYPFIDYSTGGSIDGMIRATKRNLSAVTDKMVIIPGHGPVGNKAGLSEFHDMLAAIRGNVSTLKKLGETLEETIAALSDSGRPLRPLHGGYRPAPSARMGTMKAAMRSATGSTGRLGPRCDGLHLREFQFGSAARRYSMKSPHGKLRCGRWQPKTTAHHQHSV